MKIKEITWSWSEGDGHYSHGEYTGTINGKVVGLIDDNRNNWRLILYIWVGTLRVASGAPSYNKKNRDEAVRRSKKWVYDKLTNFLNSDKSWEVELNKQGLIE